MACETMITYLLKQYSADPSIDYGKLESVLHHCIAYRGEDLVDHFMECGVDVNRQGGDFRTPLGTAAYQGNLERMKKFEAAVRPST